MPGLTSRLLGSIAALIAVPALAAHPFPVQLKGADAGVLTESSTEPYSSRQSCGGCHDVDFITQGYHFQQGRNRREANGSYTLQVSDTFNSERAWLLSDGMYGKT